MNTVNGGAPGRLVVSCCWSARSHVHLIGTAEGRGRGGAGGERQRRNAVGGRGLVNSGERVGFRGRTRARGGAGRGRTRNDAIADQVGVCGVRGRGVQRRVGKRVGVARGAVSVEGALQRHHDGLPRLRGRTGWSERWAGGRSGQS